MNTNLTRRGFIGAAAAVATVPTLSIRHARAAAPAFEYKYGTNVPATHPLSARALEAADKILKESDGRFALKVFPNNQLGGDTDMLSQVRSGALEKLGNTLKAELQTKGVLNSRIPTGPPSARRCARPGFYDARIGIGLQTVHNRSSNGC